MSAATMISISDRAASELRALLERKAAGPAQGLRLAVKRGGCAGWQYVMEVGSVEDGDEVLESGGARVIVAADSIQKLNGCEVDYSDSLSDAGFRIENPNAARSCGCGTSFETADEPASDLAEAEDCGKS
jgi:iron-sulfur cluster assembly protein